MNHAKYSEMKNLSVESIREHLRACSGTREDGRCVPGENALGTAQQDVKHKKAMARYARRNATVSGATNHDDAFSKAVGILVGTHDEFGRRKERNA